MQAKLGPASKMRRDWIRKTVRMSGFALLLPLVAGASRVAPATGEWRTYGGDLASTRYSPLDQIDASNFSKLQVAWRIKTDSFGPRPEFNLQVTPLVVNGVMYFTAGTRRAVVAADAQTGELL